MVLAVSVPRKNAQKLKRYLQNRGVFDSSHSPVARGDRILFPVTKQVVGLRAFSARMSRARLLRAPVQKRSLREFVASLLPAGSRVARASFEAVGSILVLELDTSLRAQEKNIGAYLLAVHPSAKTVVAKASAHRGKYRVQAYRYIAGARSFETVHVEHGLRMAVDLRASYFTPRWGDERMRIARQIRAGEDVLVLFSGVAPYPLVFSRHTRARSIVGVEMNPAAHAYALRNVAVNRAGNVTLLRGDARRVLPRLNRTFDRIVMPLPASACSFLGAAARVLRRRGVIHCYAFCRDEDVAQLRLRIVAELKKAGRAARMLRVVRCGQHAPRVFRVCADVLVS